MLEVPMLEVTALVAGYGLTRVLDGVSLTVGEGEIVAVLGSNGAGKTTLNMAISGLVRPRAGRVAFAGADITGRSPAEIMAAGLIQVPEGRKIFPNLNVRENLELGSYRRAKANRARNLDRVFATFPRLRERVGQAAGTLSGGEQQMLAIGRGMMAEPRLLILDEPSLGLSPLLVEEMFALIRRLHADGLSIMLVEQNVAQSLEIAHRAYVLENGSFALSGPAAQVRQDPELKRAYLGIVGERPDGSGDAGRGAGLGADGGGAPRLARCLVRLRGGHSLRPPAGGGRSAGAAGAAGLHRRHRRRRAGAGDGGAGRANGGARRRGGGAGDRAGPGRAARHGGLPERHLRHDAGARRGQPVCARPSGDPCRAGAAGRAAR
jgi:branched-chain amino acid transport system ATP-binding protein